MASVSFSMVDKTLLLTEKQVGVAVVISFSVLELVSDIHMLSLVTFEYIPLLIFVLLVSTRNVTFNG